ncbi:uncharacterized protein PHACADRAFT_33381 [Phanerochaete carnosa HHB-10118-sp]|uniref:SWI/SNF and RSC complexes subunit Ssr4 N-terminal domain-containing protein n=1 Tax=Phanerochaete carnosa (strain HHB-10118-sp) TaxID=650164 RepID=K5WI01_PHACS|nr:uncharacterized protein PHACADRAFT_33381 [Phanerochaete carnosa HHB-10118-sp]EKM49832.1 hypothetical protein PHACADRAFT_33381 [Phanerochaete carnosa HHB-10118-sp]
MAFHGLPDGACLRYPENLPPHPNLTHEMAAQMLLRATGLSQTVPFQWGYIDRPADGSLYLICILPSYPFPSDGLRYQEQEQRYTIPIGNGRELEMTEVKFGFVPGHENVASRIRRRYRLVKGGNPQLILIHYSRGQAIPVIPSLNQPVRSYPLRTINEPAVFIAGERSGQKVFPGGGPGPMPDRSGSMPPGAMGMPFGNPQVMLQQQNASMEALERRSQRERDRSGSVTGRPPPHPQQQTRIEEDEVDARYSSHPPDLAEDSESITIRALALTRYRRNHDFMNEVFMHAAYGKQLEPKPQPKGYTIFDKDELNSSISKLETEVAELEAKAAARRQAKEASELADVSMESHA